MEQKNDITISRIENEEELWHAERLYLDSFPADERRDVTTWLEYTWNKPEFYNNIIRSRGEIVGFVSLWDFGQFAYVEHFAMYGSVRGKGFGGKALELLCKKINKPVVLEVELPTNETAQRRIAFYERHGFKLCERKYAQPPYNDGLNPIEMKLMWNGAELTNDAFDPIIRKIHKEVYNR